MLIQAIRNFREKTKERYEAAEEEKMEQWKRTSVRSMKMRRFSFIMKRWSRNQTASLSF